MIMIGGENSPESLTSINDTHANHTIREGIQESLLVSCSSKGKAPLWGLDAYYFYGGN